MIKKMYTLFMLLLLGSTAFAQQKPEDLIINHEFGEKMQHIFGNLERERIPHGLLAEAAFPFTNLKKYDGKAAEKAQMSVDVLGNIYKTLQSARIHKSSTPFFKDFKELAHDWNTYRENYNKENEFEPTLVLSGLYYKYSSIKENALEDGYLKMQDSTLYDVYEGQTWKNPYEEREVIAIAPPISTINSLKFGVVFPKELFLTNLETLPTENLYINFNDGKGKVPLILDKRLVVNYPQEGLHKWEIGFIDWDGNPIRIDIPIKIENPIIIPPLGSGKNNVKINDGSYGATLRIDYAPQSNGFIKNPLIVVEGFDPESVTSPEKIGGSLTLHHFLNSINSDTQLYSLLGGSSQEYDIIYVDWKVGVGDIRWNADVLVKVIEWVNAQKEISGSTSTNVVLGQSMGGLVSSYALSKMEKEGKNHDASLFIAHDTPFQGANTPVSIQFATRQFKNAYIDHWLASAIGEVLIPFLQSLGDGLGTGWFENYTTPSTYLTIQDTPAALQMSKYHVEYGNSITSIPHNEWMTQFRAMGYPQTTRNIAISNGNMCGKPQEIGGGESILMIDGDLKNYSWLGKLGWLFAFSGDPSFLISTPFSTDEYLETLIDLRAIPEQDDPNRLTARIKVVYFTEGHIPWHWTNSHTIIPYKELNVSSSLLPLETLAGGNNNVSNVISNFDQDLVSYFVHPRPGFIPVTSALDIQRNDNQPLTINDYRKAYNEIDLSDYNMSTPFENFAVEASVDNFDNFQHISFSTKNSNWLAAELNANKNNETVYPGNCSYICDASDIVGPDIICKTGTFEFSIPTINSEEAVITWSSNGLTIVSGQGTENVIIKNNKYNTSKHKQIRVNVQTPCGSINLSKNVYVGIPDTPGGIQGVSTIFKDSAIFSFNDYEIDEVPYTTHYEWRLPGNYQTVSTLSNNSTPNANWELLASSANTSHISTKSNLTTDGYIEVRACNSCGCSDYSRLEVKHEMLDDGDFFFLSPNPVNSGGTIEIYLNEGAPSPNFSNGKTKAVIYDLQMKVRHHFIISNTGGTTTLPSLEPGLYKIQIDKQDGTYQVINMSVQN